MQTLYVQAAKGHQSLNYTEYVEHCGSRWRVTFHHNFNVDQSTGIADRWDGTTWREVFVCSPARLKLGGHSTIESVEFWEGDAALDAQYMIGMAAMIIGEKEEAA